MPLYFDLTLVFWGTGLPGQPRFVLLAVIFRGALFLPMPLIIESYDLPYTRIADLLFPNDIFQYISVLQLESLECVDTNNELYCYTRAEDDSRPVRYYFSKIYYIEDGQIVCINKTAQKIKTYDLNTGRPVYAPSSCRRETKIDKSEFLPQLMAQKGELVLFPDEEEDD